MASKRHVRLREQAKACGTKKRYDTAHDAEQALRLVRYCNTTTFQGTFAVYRCPWCYGYHFGHAKHHHS